MRGRDYKYTSFHHPEKWNAEHCKGGMSKTSDVTLCTCLL